MRYLANRTTRHAITSVGLLFCFACSEGTVPIVSSVAPEEDPPGCVVTVSSNSASEVCMEIVCPSQDDQQVCVPNAPEIPEPGCDVQTVVNQDNETCLIITCPGAAEETVCVATAAETRTTITGNVDLVAAAPGGITVTVTNPPPGQTLQATTADDGSYSITKVPVGIYDLEFTKEGYESTTLQDILVLGQTPVEVATARVNFTQRVYGAAARDYNYLSDTWTHANFRPGGRAILDFSDPDNPIVTNGLRDLHIDGGRVSSFRSVAPGIECTHVEIDSEMRLVCGDASDGSRHLLPPSYSSWMSGVTESYYVNIDVCDGTACEVTFWDLRSFEPVVVPAACGVTVVADGYWIASSGGTFAWQSSDGSAWVYDVGADVCTRVGTVTDGLTPRLSPDGQFAAFYGLPITTDGQTYPEQLYAVDVLATPGDVTSFLAYGAYTMTDERDQFSNAGAVYASTEGSGYLLTPSPVTAVAPPVTPADPPLRVGWDSYIARFDTFGGANGAWFTYDIDGPPTDPQALSLTDFHQGIVKAPIAELAAPWSGSDASVTLFGRRNQPGGYVPERGLLFPTNRATGALDLMWIDLTESTPKDQELSALLVHANVQAYKTKLSPAGDKFIYFAGGNYDASNMYLLDLDAPRGAAEAQPYRLVASSVSTQAYWVEWDSGLIAYFRNVDSSKDLGDLYVYDMVADFEFLLEPEAFFDNSTYNVAIRGRRIIYGIKAFGGNQGRDGSYTGVIPVFP